MPCRRYSPAAAAAQNNPLSSPPSSTSATKIRCAKLSSKEDTGLSCREASLVTRRGCPVVLEITFTHPIILSYTVTLSFIPVHGPRERSCTFRASGQDGKGLPGIWLSIDLPVHFPIGVYDAHISVTQENCPEILTHTLHNELAVLFNPLLPGKIIAALLIVAVLACTPHVHIFNATRCHSFCR